MVNVVVGHAKATCRRQQHCQMNRINVVALEKSTNNKKSMKKPISTEHRKNYKQTTITTTKLYNTTSTPIKQERRKYAVCKEKQKQSKESKRIRWAWKRVYIFKCTQREIWRKVPLYYKMLMHVFRKLSIQIRTFSSGYLFGNISNYYGSLTVGFIYDVVFRILVSCHFWLVF